ncbi:hypothetical protein GDO86_003439, partial [Hymenochirus boettgeri]
MDFRIGTPKKTLGSVYDISGTECCLSTGDLVKIIGKEVKFVSCVDHNEGRCYELPGNFQGLFYIVVDIDTYNTLGDLKRQLYGENLIYPFCFASRTDIILKDRVINRQHPIECVSSGNFQPTSFAVCHVWEDPKGACIKIPFSTMGQFYECATEGSYTLQQILQSPALLKRSYTCNSIGDGLYRLTPIYEIKTIMHMRKDIVKMPSSLEVEVIDITSQCGNIEFIKPLSLAQISERKEIFPVIAEIVETSECSHLINNDIFSALSKGQKIIIYRKELSRKILATAAKGKISRFFYIHAGYDGKVRHKPREFTTVYDLWTQLMLGVKLNVVVTQDSESDEDCFPSLCIGDHLKILRHTKIKVSDSCKETEVLVCEKDPTDDEEEPDEIMLPLYLQGRFVEKVKDSKRYTVSDLIQNVKLPCEVKVVTRDPSLPTDPLASFAFIKLEKLIEESVFLVSFLDNPSKCFQLPIKWTDFSLIFLKDPVPETDPQRTSITFEELNEWYYYNVWKELPSKELPPPRPPKRQGKVSVESSQKCEEDISPKCNIRKNNQPPVINPLSRKKCIPETCISQTLNAYSPLPQKSEAKK